MAAAAAASSGPAEPPASVTIDGKEYPTLADGEYDYIVLGTGLKECILAGMLAAARHKKVGPPLAPPDPQRAALRGARGRRAPALRGSPRRVARPECNLRSRQVP